MISCMILGFDLYTRILSRENDGCSIYLCYCVLVMVKYPRKPSFAQVRPVLANGDRRGHHAVNQVVRQHQINVTCPQYQAMTQAA